MRAASHGYTEHSVTFAPNGYSLPNSDVYTRDTVKYVPEITSKNTLTSTQKEAPKRPFKSLYSPVFALANANPWVNSGEWDGPYNTWVEYKFDDLFV